MIAFILAAGSGAWIFNRVSRTSGGNKSGSTKVALISALLVFVIALLLLGLVPSN